jgi:hypothetical protein
MSRMKKWQVASYALSLAFLGTAALDMRHVRGGFLTNYAADIVVPAWLYMVSRVLLAGFACGIMRYSSPRPARG